MRGRTGTRIRRGAIVGRSKMDAHIDAPVLATQPLAVDQLSSGVMDLGSAAAQELDRVVVEAFGPRALAEEGGRSGSNAEPPVGAVDGRPVFELAQRLGSDCSCVSSRRRLDELEMRPAVKLALLIVRREHC